MTKPTFKRKIARIRRKFFPLKTFDFAPPVTKPTIKKRIARCRRVLLSAAPADPAQSEAQPTLKRRIARCRRIWFPLPVSDLSHDNCSSPAGKVWFVDYNPDPRISELITKWNLDSPKDESQIGKEPSLEICGWALSSEAQQNRLHLVIRLASHTLSHPMNVDRGDVIEKVLTAKPESHPQIRCGFRYSVPMEDAFAGLEIGFETDGYIYTAAKVYLV